MTAFFYFTMTVFVVVCVFLILLILIQKGRGGGLASAFGGAGGQTAFGSKTGDVLTWATSVVFGIFVVLAVCLNLIANNINNKKLAAAAAPIPQAPPMVPPTPTLPPETTTPPSTEPTTMANMPTTLPAMPTMPATALSDAAPATTKIVDRIPMKMVFPTTTPTTLPTTLP
jgi:preprotein translocase subunit SecG